MKALVLPVLMASLVLAAGCSRDKDEPAPAASAAGDSSRTISESASRLPQSLPQATSESKTATTRATVVRQPQNPQAVRDAPPFARTGVAVCDTYSDVVLGCINKYTYAGSRADIRKTFARAVRGWQQSLEAGTPSSTVAQQCAAFRTSFAETLQAVGCPDY